MKPGKLQRGMLLLWFLRGHVVLTLHSQNTTAVVFQSKREVYHDYFSLKKFNVTSICLKTIPVQ